MSRKMDPIERFWKELQRRKVVRIASVYAAAAFIILQLVDIIAQPLQLPSWTMTFLIILMIIGFVISVLLAWIYDITPQGVKRTKSLSTVKSSEVTHHKVTGSWKVATYISLAIIILLIALNYFSRHKSDINLSKLEKSIAVLPFINDSPSDSNQYFINGVMEEILSNLQTIKDFRVLSRTSTDQFKGKERPTITEISKKLDVNYIVEGSGQKYGNMFRLRVQLIRTRGKEAHIWAKPYETEIKETKDIFSIQSQIAQSIAGELKATITPQEKSIIEKTGTVSLEALTYYQKGREDFRKYEADLYNDLLMKSAKANLQKAIGLDPSFSKAYSWLAKVYFYERLNIFVPRESLIDSVLILANTALQYDELDYEAYLSKAWYYFTSGNWDEALRSSDKAVDLNPNYWEGYEFRGYWLFLANNGDPDYIKAIENILKAISLNQGQNLPRLLRSLADIYVYQAGFPDLAYQNYKKAFDLDGDSVTLLKNLADIEFDKNHSDKEIELYKRSLAIDSDRIETNLSLAHTYAYAGNFKESLRYYEKVIENYQKTGQLWQASMHRFGYCYWQNGNKEEGRFWLNRQKEICERTIRSKGFLATVGLDSYYDLAGVYAFLGDRKKAYLNLHEFSRIKAFPRWWLVFIKFDPLFDSIRNEPEFQRIVSELEAKYQAEHDRVGKWLEEKGMI